MQRLRKLHFVGGTERPCTITTHTVLTAHFTFGKNPVGELESKKSRWKPRRLIQRKWESGERRAAIKPLQGKLQCSIWRNKKGLLNCPDGTALVSNANTDRR